MLLCIGVNQIQHHKNHVLMKYPRHVSVMLLRVAEWSQSHFQARPWCLLTHFEVPFQRVFAVLQVRLWTLSPKRWLLK